MLKQVIWLEIKRSNIFQHKKCRFCILKNIATIPLLQQLPETLRIPRQMASQYNHMLGSKRIKC